MAYSNGYVGGYTVQGGGGGGRHQGKGDAGRPADLMPAVQSWRLGRVRGKRDYKRRYWK